MISIRPAITGDARSLLSLYKALDDETAFMLFEPSERTTTVNEQKQIIDGFATSPGKTLLIAVDDQSDEIVGFVVGLGGAWQRNSKSLHCVIGIRQAYTGQGLGGKLLAELEAWALSSGFRRMELTVMEHNTAGIKLYEKFGFEREGIKKDSLLVNGNFVTEFLMAKLI